MAVPKDPRSLEVAEPFVSLFPIDPETLRLVTDSIHERGFQIDKPILIWKDAFGERGRQVVIDGHIRRRAALDLKLSEVWTTVRQFKNVDAAITAAIGEQVQRRNLNREQIAAHVVSILPLLDETKGGLRTRTAKELASLLGVSKPTIDRARSLLDSGRADLVEAVKSGGTSLLAAWQESLDAPAKPDVAAAGERLRQREAEVRGDLAAGIPGPEMTDQDIADLETLVDAAEVETLSPSEMHARVKKIRAAVPEVVDPENQVETPEQRLLEILHLPDMIDMLVDDLRKATLGVTVTAHGRKGPFRIAQIQFHPSGAIYAIDGSGKKKIDVRDITAVVKLPEALNA